MSGFGSRDEAFRDLYRRVRQLEQKADASHVFQACSECSGSGCKCWGLLVTFCDACSGKGGKTVPLRLEDARGL